MANEFLETERVRDGQASGGQETQAASLQEAGSGRKPRRSKRRSQDPQGRPEMALRSVAEVLRSDEATQASSDSLFAEQSEAQRRIGRDDSPAIPEPTPRVSCMALLAGASFNADGECKIQFESFDLERVVELRKMRGTWLTLTVEPHNYGGSV